MKASKPLPDSFSPSFSASRARATASNSTGAVTPSSAWTASASTPSRSTPCSRRPRLLPPQPPPELPIPHKQLSVINYELPHFRFVYPLCTHHDPLNCSSCSATSSPAYCL